MNHNNTLKFGLVGKNISYSFSKQYFTKKFKDLKLENYQFLNFDIPEIFEFPFLLYQRKNEFRGLNVTIPYKQSILKYLDKISPEAKEIGAVNTIHINKKEELIGHNTDYYGFKKSIEPLLKKHHTKALVLGTGGASKAITYALKKLNIGFTLVSRTPNSNQIGYEQLNASILASHTIIVNTTPVGTYPDVKNAPSIPYKYITEKHLCYDLIYNPEITQFLENAQQNKATIKNGLQMLELQAEKSWEIWNS